MVRTVSERLRQLVSAHPLAVDLAVYLACAVYALILARTNEFYGFRVWGNFATAAYGLAFAHTAWLLATRNREQRAWWRSRWVGVVTIGVVGMLAPLLTLVVRRLTGVDWLITPWSWSAQPEVWVIERSAKLLFENGTPYVDVHALGRLPEVNDYTPYGPVMTVFGMPRALFGDTPFTDARLMFALTAALCVWASLRLLGRPRVPVAAAQLAVAFPLTALTFAVAGPDLAIIGLVVLGTALAAKDHHLPAAAVMALVVSAKLTALPAAVVVAVLIAARLGARALGTATLAFAGVCAVVNLPVLLADPAAFAEHVVRFPAGLGAVDSPATSPFPGYLIASTGELGHVLAIALLAAAALAVSWWLLRRPPVTGADAMFRIAVGLGTSILLTPATRFGYLVYPVALFGAMLCFPRETPDERIVTSS
ncbi:glycosyltransferase 87 family protein [Amycolatopsis sp. YIM 10]|uniref:glycosyltransferase 87 family protein n=1 Tax=Amycolatopsis sp. YIM 10 TaxID=2653857 RepID=UPI0012905733|nr:glycosyltransferase 87 family protein [Amycolatopsis sp. YIM 10]QFU88834.1 hypothetical protein YIM_18270 [Amycolatopsis sp. YIM 10]